MGLEEISSVQGRTGEICSAERPASEISSAQLAGYLQQDRSVRVENDHGLSSSGLTTCGSAAGEVPAASEFYGPLFATGGQHRAEPGALRARQLQPLVRPRARTASKARQPLHSIRAQRRPG